MVYSSWACPYFQFWFVFQTHHWAVSATLESVDGLAILIQLTVVPCPAVHIWHWAWQFQVFLVERRLIFVNLTQMVPLRYCGLMCKWGVGIFSITFIWNIITEHMLKVTRSNISICSHVVNKNLVSLPITKRILIGAGCFCSQISQALWPLSTLNRGNFLIREASRIPTSNTDFVLASFENANFFVTFLFVYLPLIAYHWRAKYLAWCHELWLYDVINYKSISVPV